MKLLPIEEQLEANAHLMQNPLCAEGVAMCVAFYQRVGFVPPWICYFVQDNHEIVGSAGFKGPPAERKVEIAYGTFEPFQGKGFGTKICKLLVELALKTDPTIIITARTFELDNHSSRILQKNGFKFIGMVNDPEDGLVPEWEYQK
jgi:[ribosomal protein S5]-alanine N-acetyltransferase